MSTYLISDTHFFHANIIRWRNQFESIEEHNEHIVDNWNQTITKRDTVFHLGDFAWMVGYRMQDVLQFEMDLAMLTQRLNGKIKLMPGNHDEILPPSTTKRYVMTNTYNPDLEVINQGLLKYKEFWLSHCPIHPAELRGRVNIHGHVHENTVSLNTIGQWDGTAWVKKNDSQYVNVSCEAINYTPISLEEIRERCKN